MWVSPCVGREVFTASARIMPCASAVARSVLFAPRVIFPYPKDDYGAMPLEVGSAKVLFNG